MTEKEIEKIEEMALSLNLITVDDVCHYSAMQLIYMVINRLNEVIGSVNGIHGSITDILNQWVENGTFDDILAQSKLGKYTEPSRINALSFGIKEGRDVDVEENTRCLQNAIDYCKNDKVLVFPSGDYVFKPIDLGEKNNILIEGVSSSFGTFAQKNIYTGKIKDTLTKIICDLQPGETFFNHKNCVLVLENISFYNLKKDEKGMFTDEEAKLGVLMKHTRTEGQGKNTEKGKAFCLNCGFFGFKVCFGSEFTFQHLEDEWQTGLRFENYEYLKQSCVMASRCRFTRNGIAINQSVDGRLVDCSFNKNDYAIVLRENSGFTTISNCRIEWNNYNGIYSEKAHEVTVSNCEFDCNGYAGLYAVENTNSNFNGIFRRNGAKVISDTEDTRDDFVNNVHIYAHRNVNCNFIGSNTTVKATSDVGSAPERPTNCSNFSENVNCVITSNNLYGCTKKDKEDANRFKNNVDCFFENNMSDNEVFDVKSAIAKTDVQLSEKASVLNTLDFINVVSLGVDNSGQTDVADMLQDIIDNAKVHATIYFPTGEYLISKGLVVKKPITIKGNSRHINDIPPYGASIIRVKDGVSNITALSTKNNGLRWSVDGITFYSTSFSLNHVEGVEVGLKYTPNVVNQNVNGLNMGTDSHYSSCNNVFAWGFSGTGIHLGGDSLNKNICACNCGLGIVLETDASLDNFRSQFCEYGFVAKTGTTITNGRVEEISKFGVTFNDAIGGLMRNVVIDQCGYSGIRLKGIVTEINVEVDIVRCCSYYYGLTTEQILSSENIKNEAIAKIYIDENTSVSNNIIKDVGYLAMGLDDDVRGLFTPFFINTKSDIYGGCEFYCNGLNIGQKFSTSSNNTTLCEEYKKTIFRTTKDRLSNTIISDYKNSITIDNTMIRKIDNIIFGGTWIAPEFFGQFNISDNTLYIAKGLTSSDWVLINKLETIGQ